MTEPESAAAGQAPSGEAARDDAAVEEATVEEATVAARHRHAELSVELTRPGAG